MKKELAFWKNISKYNYVVVEKINDKHKGWKYKMVNIGDNIECVCFSGKTIDKSIHNLVEKPGVYTLTESRWCEDLKLFFNRIGLPIKMDVKIILRNPDNPKQMKYALYGFWKKEELWKTKL